MDFNLGKALRTIALRDVLQEHSEYQVRFVQRWYSQRFHTPLREVEELDLEHLLQHFYEVKYEEMDDPAREKERLELIESPEQERKRRMEEAFENYAALLFEQESAILAKTLKEQKAMKEHAASLERGARPVVQHISLPESKLDGVPTMMGERLEPNINMTFLSAAEMEAQLEGPSVTGADDPSTGNLDLISPKSK